MAERFLAGGCSLNNLLKETNKKRLIIVYGSEKLLTYIENLQHIHRNY